MIYDGASFARYMEGGYLLLARQGFLFAARFDIERLEIVGELVPVLENVSGAKNSGVVHFGISTGGILSYVPGTLRSRESKLAWIYEDGSVADLPSPMRGYISPALSPDGKQVVVAIAGEDRFDLWKLSVEDGTPTRLTFEGDSQAPLWHPDQSSIIYSSALDGTNRVRIISADGSSGENDLHFEKSIALLATGISPDGTKLLVTRNDDLAKRDIQIVDLQDPTKVTTFLNTPFDEGEANFSPDGRHVVYTSDDSGQPEVYIRSADGIGGRWQVSSDFGFLPLWPVGSNEIYYLTRDSLQSVQVETEGDGFRFGQRKTWVKLAPTMLDDPDFNIDTKNRRVLMVMPSDVAERLRTNSAIRVVTNWDEYVRQRLVADGSQ